MTKTRKIEILDRARNYFVEKTFSLWQLLGLNISLNNYYSPVPDVKTLKEVLWSSPSKLVGIDMNEEEQLKLLSLFVFLFKTEYESFPKGKTKTPYEYYVNNAFFGSVDGEILYCIIRHFKPRKIFEIGSGFSTYLTSQAILRNKKEDSAYDCNFVVVDPYPNETIRRGFSGLSRIVMNKVQDVPLSEFQKLKDNDILFIDSSHVLKIGSDVQFEYLEIVPRLSRGVIIHSHDIFLPSEYHKSWILKEHIFWNEQYLLQAFLAFNNSYKVLWAGNYMHLRHPKELRLAFSSYTGETPASFWIKKDK